MEDEDKLHARHLRDREKCKNEFPEWKTTITQACSHNTLYSI